MTSEAMMTEAPQTIKATATIAEKWLSFLSKSRLQSPLMGAA
jgi:hypothetical protein